MPKDIVKIKRINNFEFSFSESTKGGIKYVVKALTFQNPDPYAYSSKIIKFDRKTLTFKIGMLNTLIDFLKENDVTYSLYDYDYSLPKNVQIDDRLQGKYNHQKIAVEEFYKKRFGILAVPTRGGKTFIASEILRIFLNSDDGNFLFIVDNTTLFSQAVRDFKGFFEKYGGIEIGEIKEGIVDTSKRVTIAMIQTIQSALKSKDRNKRLNLLKYFKELKFLSIDEIHDNFSTSKYAIYRKCKNIEYLLCLSATPYKANNLVQNLKLMEWSGDIIYSIDEDVLIKRKVLSEYKVFMLLVDHNNIDYEIEEKDYLGYRNELIIKNKMRDDLLLMVMKILENLNLKTLILFTSVEHGKRVEENTGVTFISGKDDEESREEAKNKFLNRKGGFLLASNIFKKGITLPEVEVLINVDGGLEDANTIQKKGRVLGFLENKERSLIIDFFDLYDLYFSEHSETRLNTYISSVGEKKVGILDTSIDDWLETLENWVKKWFKIKNNYSDLQ